MSHSNIFFLSTQIITLPFPPVISAQDFLDRRSPDRATAKSPNAFFIYRKDFVNYLQVCNYNLKMRDVSSMAGSSWKVASKEVKDAYKQIARDVEKLLIAQRQSRFEESKRNRSNHDNNEGHTLSPIYLEPSYHFHDTSTSYFPQQPPSMSVNSWFIPDQQFQPRQETIYDPSSQYNSQLMFPYDHNQFVIPPSHVVENNQQIEFFQWILSQPNNTFVDNFPFISAINQFTTYDFNEDLVHWQQSDEEEQQY